jgi:hypothetical protein
MRFTVNENFKARGHLSFEAGNTHNSDILPPEVDEARLRVWWERGWIEVDGWDKAPERKPGAAKLDVHNSKFASKAKGA